MISVTDDFIIGRNVAKDIVNLDTGELIARANDEITESMLVEMRASGMRKLETLYINELDHGGYISQTLRIDDTADQMAARIAIYRMMRPGEQPPEEAVKNLLHYFLYT